MVTIFCMKKKKKETFPSSWLAFLGGYMPFTTSFMEIVRAKRQTNFCNQEQKDRERKNKRQLFFYKNVFWSLIFSKNNLPELSTEINDFSSASRVKKYHPNQAKWIILLSGSLHEFGKNLGLFYVFRVKRTEFCPRTFFWLISYLA